MCGDVNDPIPPPPIAEKLYVYDPHHETPDNHEWPPGLYGTDAGGGEWGGYPELRRCGAGIARVQSVAPFRVLWAAHAPLPGLVQTVPRAELYAITLVTSKMSHGIVHVVSDSKINVDLFGRGRNACLVSANSDPWRHMFENVDSKSLTLRLFWVPVHLDKTVAKIQRRVPDVHFAFNCAADKLADEAARLVQLPMQIQRRLVRIPITNLEKSMYEKKVSVLVSKPKLSDYIHNTQHNLVSEGNSFRCADCGSFVSKASPNIVTWLKSECQALPFDDIAEPLSVPGWYRIQVGNSIPHSSHALHMYRGVLFCYNCGAYGAKKCKKLAYDCEKHCSVSSLRARDKLMQGHLPTSFMKWPRFSCRVFKPPGGASNVANCVATDAPVTLLFIPPARLWIPPRLWLGGLQAVT